MNISKFNPEDPRLTAYALGEMEPAECAEFEQWLRLQPDAQKVVEEIRATAALLGTALADEAPADHDHVIDAAAVLAAQPPAPAQPEDEYRKKRSKLLRFPALYYMTASLAAACFAVMFFTSAEYEAKEKKHYIEMDAAVADSLRAAKERQAAVAQEQVRKAENEKQASRDLAVTFALPSTTAPTAAPSSALADASTTVELPIATASTPPPQPDAVQLAAIDITGSRTAASESPTLAAAPVAVAQEPVSNAPAPAPVTTLESRSAIDANVVAAAPTPLPVSARPNAATQPTSSDEVITLSAFSVSGASRNGAGKQRLAAKAKRAPADRREQFNTESYTHTPENPFLTVAQNPLSTFSVDVDTASYANVRRFLHDKHLPPPAAVRIEELVNYFPYRYAPPSGNAPFAAHLEVASAPWAPDHRLVRIGLKGREISDAARPQANLVFLLDVSGSMNQPNKLPLVQQSLRLMLEKLRSDDRVAIVVYAGASGLALPSTSLREKAKIAAAIDELRAEGSTNGAAGIQLAYYIAKANFVSGGVNRVVLATDGDFNVGVSSEGELTSLIEEKAKSGVFLSVLGFGMGNYKDSTLEKLADKGNGNYAYIDSLAEAKKTLVEQAGGTLVTIAKDVKLQVEFNPAVAQAYRLIGYENRMLRKEDFNNDKVDAGEIGAGHTVTALYEVIPVGVPMPEEASVDALKYQKTVTGERKTEDRGRTAAANASGELLTLKVRYKEPAGLISSKLEFPLRDTGTAFADASADFKFAAAVASFGMTLKNSPYRGEMKLADIAQWAREGTTDDAGGYRAEFVELVNEAATMMEN